MERAPHCPTCATYEARVMARKEGEELPPDVKPCPAFAISDKFQAWAVDQMRREVMSQVSGAGLDRMAMLKSKPDPKAGRPKA